MKLKQSRYEEKLISIAGQMVEMLIRMKDIETQTVYGNTGPSHENGFLVMEIQEQYGILKCVSYGKA